ncbi:unnamed protein product [Penicillium nalgiovense]|uniref:Uncharacterized protein n=1 Tax=Penicillium nalgiovense TaxID=60175 RepID=A0A9W4I4B2_PENNA|nr:unnamed protein product [Penicillium nalgiovense]CAG8179646.1 unnamed protein product [Penicillium nalgiovense]CAG8180473.1 unnamed protein product [Penicillium nalgiovense]CAG8230096.1 unnamed protein product [Penicillium nalgiovense]CAG8233527.1 unnamed protein product [Penicillium nalgiovense]
MVSNAGVKKTPNNDRKAPKHRQETLENLLGEAQKEENSNEEGPSDGKQGAAAPGPVDDRPSADRGQPDQPNSSQRSDISGDPHDERGPADETPVRDEEMSDAEPKLTDESTSDGTAGAQTRGMNDSSVGPQLFVDFEKLNINEGRPEKKERHEDPQPGDIAGFGGTGKSRFFIFRVGPAQAPRHVFRRTRAYSTEGFENLSHNRISLLRYNDPNGDRHWQYTRRNIAGFRGIAIDETESNLKCPQTWINVEWKDIKEEHRYLLVDECSWTPRTDVIRLSGRKVASTGIRAIWALQETLHIKAMQKEGKLVSHLPFPLDTFEAEKIKPERSRTPAQLGSFSSTPKSRSSISGDNMANGIKQEQEQEISTVVPSRSATQDAPGSNVVEVESSGSSPSKNQAPKRFNVQAYMASVEKMEKWNEMSEAEREKRYRIALANYDHYREERLNKGDVEVGDEL